MTTPSRLRPPPAAPGPHPAISLAIGLSVIIFGAFIVHLVFNVLV